MFDYEFDKTASERNRTWTPAVLSVLFACFAVLYLHLFSAFERVSLGKAFSLEICSLLLLLLLVMVVSCAVQMGAVISK